MRSGEEYSRKTEKQVQRPWYKGWRFTEQHGVQRALGNAAARWAREQIMGPPMPQERLWLLFSVIQQSNNLCSFVHLFQMHLLFAGGAGATGCPQQTQFLLLPFTLH